MSKRRSPGVGRRESARITDVQGREPGWKGASERGGPVAGVVDAGAPGRGVYQRLGWTRKVLPRGLESSLKLTLRLGLLDSTERVFSPYLISGFLEISV